MRLSKIYSNLLLVLRTQKPQKSNVLFRKSSKYGVITVEEDPKKNIREIKRDGKRLSGINLKTLTPTSSLLRYPHLIEIVTPRARKVLSLGGGACAFPIYLLDRNPDYKVDVIEINKVVIRAARKFFPLPKTSNFRLINADALKWVKSCKTEYDLIFIDVGIVYSSSYQAFNLKFLERNLFKYYTRILTTKGVLMINLIITAQKHDFEKVKYKFSPFKSFFKHGLKFITNPNNKFGLQDIVYVFSNANISIEKLKKNLTCTPSATLSYPKKIYRFILKTYKI